MHVQYSLNRVENFHLTTLFFARSETNWRLIKRVFNYV